LIRAEITALLAVVIDADLMRQPLTGLANNALRRNDTGVAFALVMQPGGYCAHQGI
jgi:hypothetical protein